MAKILKNKKHNSVTLLPNSIREIVHHNKIFSELDFTNMNFNTIHYKIFAYIMFNFRKIIEKKFEGIELNLFNEYSFTLELKELSAANHYDDYIRIAKEFSKTSLEFKEKKQTGFYPLFSEVIVTDDRTKTIKFTINPKALDNSIKYLTLIESEDSNNYTKKINYNNYILEVISNLKSKYTILIYEFISNWKNRGGVRISLEKFRSEVLKLKPNEYTKYKDLEINCILPAYKELYCQANSWFEIGAEYNDKPFIEKTKNKITHLNFKIVQPFGIGELFHIYNNNHKTPEELKKYASITQNEKEDILAYYKSMLFTSIFKLNEAFPNFFSFDEIEIYTSLINNYFSDTDTLTKNNKELSKAILNVIVFSRECYIIHFKYINKKTQESVIENKKKFILNKFMKCFQNKTS